MKTLLKILSAILILSTLAACTAQGGDDDKTTDGTTEETTAAVTYQRKPKSEISIGYLGDSITLGYSLKDQSKTRFSALITNTYGTLENNQGICGTLVARAGQNRADNLDYVDRISLIKDDDLAIIFGGTNDYFWSDLPIYPDENDTEREPYEYFSDALDKICQYILDNRDPSLTLLVTPYPHKGIGNYEGSGHYRLSNEHETSEKNFNGHVMADYVKAIKDAGEKYGIEVLDLHTDSDFDYKTMTTDGCHPNEEGHEWLANKIGAWVKGKLALIAE